MTPAEIKARMLARFTQYPTDRWHDIQDILNTYAEVCAEIIREQRQPARQDMPSVDEIIRQFSIGWDKYVDHNHPSIAEVHARVAHEMMTKMAPRKRMMIEGISEKTIAGWIENDLGASLERPLSTYAGISPAYLIKAAARTVHRLANTPAPEADQDGEISEEDMERIRKLIAWADARAGRGA